jgi:hypothetical protein
MATGTGRSALFESIIWYGRVCIFLICHLGLRHGLIQTAMAVENTPMLAATIPAFELFVLS